MDSLTFPSVFFRICNYKEDRLQFFHLFSAVEAQREAATAPILRRRCLAVEPTNGLGSAPRSSRGGPIVERRSGHSNARGARGRVGGRRSCPIFRPQACDVRPETQADRPTLLCLAGGMITPKLALSGLRCDSAELRSATGAVSGC